MANSLLDFVMSLVRDPAAAARYAADPAQVIADAHLAGVTTADVDNLIPTVSDSLAMTNPGGVAPGMGLADHGSVWASGAAAAALDAFTPHQPGDVFAGQHSVPAGVISDHPPVAGSGAPVDMPADPGLSGAELHDPAALVIDTGDDVGFADHGVWADPVVDPHTVDPDHPDHHGLEGFAGLGGIL